MTELLILFAILFIFFLLGVPVAFSLGIATVIGILIYLDARQLFQLVDITFSQGTSTSLMVAPLFILMSEFLVQGGLAKDIFSVISRWLRNIPGSLAVSNIFACSIFAALCGSSPVTAATIGKISIPQMVRNGYEKKFSMGSTVGGGVIGILIPPSITMVIFGIITETSISKLFIGGIIPGLLLALMFVGYIMVIVKLKPELINSKNKVIERNNEEFTSLVKDFMLILPSVLLIVIVLGSMYLGVVTPTEAAGVGALGAFLILIGMKRINLAVFKTVMLETAKTTSMLMFIIITGLCFSYLLTSLSVPQLVTNLILEVNASKWIILFLIYLLWIIMGALLDPGSMIIITMPLLFQPLVNLGFDPIWIGVISTVAVGIGMITPPIGLNLFVVKGITGESFEDVVAGSMPFLGVVIVFLLILTFIPEIIMFLPNRM